MLVHQNTFKDKSIILPPEILYGPAMNGWLESSKGFHKSTHAMPDFEPAINYICSDSKVDTLLCLGVGSADTELFLCNKINQLYPNKVQDLILHDICANHVGKIVQVFQNNTRFPRIKSISDTLENIVSKKMELNLSQKNKIITLFGYTWSNAKNFSDFSKLIASILNPGDFILFDFPTLFMKDDSRLDKKGASESDQSWYRSAIRSFLGDDHLLDAEIVFKRIVEDLFTEEELIVDDNRNIQKENITNYRIKILAEILKKNITIEVQRYGRMSPDFLKEKLQEYSIAVYNHWLFPARFSYFVCAQKT